MKKIAILVVCAFCLSLIAPMVGEAGGYYYHGGCYGGCGNYWVPAAIVGGAILAGALFIGTMNYQASKPAPPPQPVPYASPDPNFVARYGTAPAPSPPPQQQPTGGQWVTVPAQQVGSTWVPAHRVFVPNS